MEDWLSEKITVSHTHFKRSRFRTEMPVIQWEKA